MLLKYLDEMKDANTFFKLHPHIFASLNVLYIYQPNFQQVFGAVQ